MARGLTALAAAGVALFAFLAVPGLRHLDAAVPGACDIVGVERVVAIGDVHGAHARLIEILKRTGLVNAELHWVGGKAHLAQLGDILDRGPDSRKVMDLY